MQQMTICYLVFVKKRIPGILLQKLPGFRVAQSNPVIQIPKPYDPPSVMENKILSEHKNKKYRLIMTKQEL